MELELERELELEPDWSWSWSWSWSSNGRWNGSCSRNHTILENYSLTRQNPDFGPKCRFGLQTIIKLFLNRKFWTQVVKMEK